MSRLHQKRLASKRDRVAYKSDGAVFVLARTLAEVFKADNARFDFVRFFTACGMNDDGTNWAI
jgi:hypothetical protein